MHACLPSLPDCLAHICIRVERSRAEEHSKRSLWSLSLCLFDAPCGNTPADLRTRRWCWVLSGCVYGCWPVCMCDLCKGNDVYRRNGHSNLSRPWLQSKWAHTHTPAWLPYFVKVKCIQARGNEKAPLSFLPFFRIIKHHAGSDNHNCQATDLHPTPSPHDFSENVISHFRLSSNSRQCTEIICGFWLVRVLTTLSAHISSSVSLPHLPYLVPFTSPPSSLALHTSPLYHPFPPLISFSSLLCLVCQYDFRLVASGLT